MDGVLDGERLVVLRGLSGLTPLLLDRPVYLELRKLWQERTRVALLPCEQSPFSSGQLAGGLFVLF